jgi:hypothetical protein
MVKWTTLIVLMATFCHHVPDGFSAEYYLRHQQLRSDRENHCWNYLHFLTANTKTIYGCKYIIWISTRQFLQAQATVFFSLPR